MKTSNIHKNSRDFLIEWNYKFPMDRWWRQKYNIALFSEEHLNANQLFIALEYNESIIFEEFIKLGEDQSRKEKDYKAGLLISPNILDSTQENNLFDNLDISTIKNDNSQLQFEE